ncbi:MAG: ribonuclease P protein component [Silvanigrellaceae bacterium]
MRIATSSPVFEVAIVTSKKQVSKKAVKRNLTKRRVRAALQMVDLATHSERLENSGVSRITLLLVCNRETTTTPFAKLVEDLQKAIARTLDQVFSRIGDSNEPNS